MIKIKYNENNKSKWQLFEYHQHNNSICEYGNPVAMDIKNLQVHISPSEFSYYIFIFIRANSKIRDSFFKINTTWSYSFNFVFKWFIWLKYNPV